MKRIKRVNPINPIKLACVNTKDTGRMLGVSVAVVGTYVEKGKLQRIPVGSSRMVPLYEIADLLGITFEEVVAITGKRGIVVCLVWIEASATSTRFSEVAV